MPYIIDNVQSKQCTGCGACAQICPKKAVYMVYDDEKFLYPVVDNALCIECGLCEKSCHILHPAPRVHAIEGMAFGGYIKDNAIRAASTSGGMFTAIVNAFCDTDSVIFGAVADSPIYVYHTFVQSIDDIGVFRKSKYMQSIIGDAYIDVKRFLLQRKKVLFSGTPCQIAGLYSFLGRSYDNLLTVDMVCHGVPSPLFIEKEKEWVEHKCHSQVTHIDYRDKKYNHWDRYQLTFFLSNGRAYAKNRYTDPFYRVWLDELISRPACYQCLYANTARVSDITLADFWTVERYNPSLYNGNRGTSAMIVSTEKGRQVMEKLTEKAYVIPISLQYLVDHNAPLRHAAVCNPCRDAFFADMQVCDFDTICKIYAHRAWKYRIRKSTLIYYVKKMKRNISQKLHKRN